MPASSAEPQSPSQPLHPWYRVLLVLASALLLWSICTALDPAGWILGVPASLLFTWTVFSNERSRHPLRFRALPGFLLYFIFQSFRTGLDVARRALHPKREIHPGFCDYPSRLPEGVPQAVFANMITLLPGSLSWSLTEGVHKIHLLSGHPMILEELAQLESRVGELFGIEIPEELI